MRALKILCLGILLIAAAARGADPSARLVRTAMDPAGSTRVVVAEGDFEPRSAGSYSLRVYAAADPQLPYDRFVAGTIRPRAGQLEDVRFAAVDGSGSPAIVVVVRSVGSGGYASADAFRQHGTALTLLATVSGLAPGTDPIRALAAELRSGSTQLAARAANPPEP